jgi:hypothetical protein
MCELFLNNCLEITARSLNSHTELQWDYVKNSTDIRPQIEYIILVAYSIVAGIKHITLSPMDIIISNSFYCNYIFGLKYIMFKRLIKCNNIFCL